MILDSSKFRCGPDRQHPVILYRLKYASRFGRILGAVLLGISLPLAAQTPATTVMIPVPVAAPEFQVLPDYGAGNPRANQLRGAAEKDYTFDRASLRDVLRYLAYEAGIQYVALQESSAAENTLITFTLRSSPFRVLEIIANSNGISLFYENGVWFMRPINEQELIARTYKMRFNPQQRIKYEPEGTNANQQASSSGTSANGAMNIDIQGASNVFKEETPEIVDQIKAMLGIPTTGLNGQQIPAEVGGTINKQPSALVPPGGSRFIENAGAAAGGAQVVYNADSATIYVIATRQQHQWVEGLLSSTDRPQDLIAIEVKFFETNKNPFKELGINWNETLRGGYNVGVSDIQAEINVNAIENPITGAFTGGVFVPATATLTAQDINLKLQAFEGDDRNTTLVSYPRVLTLNNREVVIRSVRNEPVLAGASSVTAGTGTQASTVSYLPLGTIINILPKTMPDGSVILNVAITISERIGEVPINVLGQDNPYPVVSSRVYNAAIQVNSGNTLAIGGLERTQDENNHNGVPLLKDIPGVGGLFRSKTKSRQKENLIFFITPTVIKDRSSTGGISESPSAVIPVRPGDPTAPTFTPDGRLVGGERAIDEALAWLAFRLKYFQQVNRENRTEKETLIQIQALINTGNQIFAEIQRLQAESPSRMLNLVHKEEQILTTLKDLDRLYKAASKNLL